MVIQQKTLRFGFKVIAKTYSLDGKHNGYLLKNQSGQIEISIDDLRRYE